MLLFLALSALAAATLGSVVVYQRGSAARLRAGGALAALPGADDAAGTAAAAGREPPKPRAEATIETLDLGDVVLDGVDDWVVVGRVGYQEERHTWALFVLDGGRHSRLLEVKRRLGRAEAALCELVDDVPTFGQLGQGLTYRDKPFTLDGRGDARTTIDGEVKERAAGRLKYARYGGPGGAVLVVEEEGERKRAYFGHVVPEAALTIYDGDLNR